MRNGKPSMNSSPLRDQKKDFLRAKQNADMILRRQQEERDERPREK